MRFAQSISGHAVILRSPDCSSIRFICSAPGSNAQLGAPLRIGEACTFSSFRTNNYKLHFLESPAGVKVRSLYH